MLAYAPNVDPGIAQYRRHVEANTPVMPSQPIPRCGTQARSPAMNFACLPSRTHRERCSGAVDVRGRLTGFHNVKAPAGHIDACSGMHAAPRHLSCIGRSVCQARRILHQPSCGWLPGLCASSLRLHQPLKPVRLKVGIDPMHERCKTRRLLDFPVCRPSSA